ncbi:MAG: hypothetical protein IT452_06835, partial [Planctomycetia bacterium]|nr:hypothetical protein [Planctomycetia bacterium]
MNRWMVLAWLCSVGASAENAGAPDEVRIRAAAADLVSPDTAKSDAARQDLLAAGRGALPALREEKKRRQDSGELASLSRVIRILDPEVSEREPVDSIGPFALSPDGKGYVVREKEDRLVANLGERTPLEAPRQKEPPGILRRDRTVTAVCFAAVDEVAVAWAGDGSLSTFDARTGGKTGTLDIPLGLGPGKPASHWVRLLRLTDSAVVSGRHDGIAVHFRGKAGPTLTTGEVDPRLSGWAIQPGGILAILKNPEGNLLQRWTVANWKLAAKRPLPLPDANLLASSRDRPCILVASSSSGKYSTSVDGGAAFATPAASGLNPGELSSVAVCPDGAWVALGCTSDRVQLRLATTWELLAELKTSGP